MKVAPPTLHRVRITPAARDRLTHAGNTLVPVSGPPPFPWHETGVVCDVTLRRPPRAGLLLVLVGQGGAQHDAIRCDTDPPFPGEWPLDAQSWWARGQLNIGCPRCGSALVWFEAGYVPGMRICLRGHKGVIGPPAATDDE